MQIYSEQRRSIQNEFIKVMVNSIMSSHHTYTINTQPEIIGNRDMPFIKRKLTSFLTLQLNVAFSTNTNQICQLAN